MGKPSSTNTVTQQSQPPAYVANAFQNAVGQAQNVASTPYQPYGGQIVAPFNNWQQGAIDASTFGTTNYEPYAALAQQDLGQAATPLYDTVNNYLSPYTQDVVNTTEQQFNNQNAIQQSQVQGNAVAQGAWGGDRSAVAQGIVAGQQQANEAPVIAGLENTGYQTALNANEAQNWLLSNAAGQENQIGTTNFGVNQSTLNQMMQFGNEAQAQTQANLNVPYYQYLAGQAYPFQTTGWLANIDEGLGSGAGGSGSTTSPGASPISQALGLGIGGAGLLGATGAFGANGYLTGAGGLFGAAADAGSFDPALAAVAGGSAAADFSGGLLGLGAAALKSGGRVHNGIVLTRPYDGIVPHRDSGGQISDSATAALLNAFSATGKPDIDALRRGGIVRRADGGDVPFQLGPMPYQEIPASSSVPNVGISVVPQLPQMRGGTGPPRPPQAVAQTSSMTPQGIMGMLQQSGGFGQSGWLGQLSGARRGGGISPPRYQDGGDLVSGMSPPDQPAYLGISPDMRSSAGPTIAPIQPAPSVDPASRAGVVNFWVQQGATPQAARGIADRVAAESGFNPSASGDLGTSHGLYQEHGPRADAMKDFANSAGAPPSDPLVQNQFAASEVHGGDPIATKHWQEIANAPDEATAAKLWDQYFERSAGSRQRPQGSQDASLGVVPPGTPQPPLEAQMSSDGTWGVPPPSMPAAGIAGQPAGMYSPGVNPWLALAAAGFATAAGRSPQALQNLGAGMLTGVQTLEQERAALPEQQLKLAQGQMATLQTQNAQALHAALQNPGVRAYFSGQSNDPSPVADRIDTNIENVKSGIAKSGETNAVTTPAGTVAPLPGQATPLSSDEQAIHAQVQEQIANIDEQIRQQTFMRQFSTTPDQLNQSQSTLATLSMKRADLMKDDLAYIRLASQATGEGKVGPAIQQAAGEAAAKLPYTVTTGRPGGYIIQGGQPVGAIPVQRNEVDPQTGAEYPRFVTPPLPGQTQGAGQPTAPAGQATSAGIAPGTLPIKLGPGQETALKERAEAEQKDRQETIEGGEAAQTQQAILSRLKDDAPQFTQGPFASYTQTANSYMRALFGTQAPQVASYEDFIKNAGALTRAAVRETSSRAAVQEFRLIDATLPSPEMSPQGLQQVINEYQGLNDFKQAKVQAQQQWEQQHGGIGNVQGFETDWQAKVSPYAFVFNRMDPGEQTSLVNRLRGTPDGRAELSRLAQQLQYAKSAGLEPYIQ